MLDDYSVIPIYPIWQNLPETVNFLFEKRSTLDISSQESLRKGINTNIIFCSTCIIEGFLNDIIEIFELLTGKKSNSLIGTYNYNSVSQLFIFRNSLIHGKRFEVRYKKSKRNINTNPEYEKTVSYLKGENLISKTEDEIDILKNCIVEFFYNQTKQFVTSLYSKIKIGQLDVIMGQAISQLK